MRKKVDKEWVATTLTSLRTELAPKLEEAKELLRKAAEASIEPSWLPGSLSEDLEVVLHAYEESIQKAEQATEETSFPKLVNPSRTLFTNDLWCWRIYGLSGRTGLGTYVRSNIRGRLHYNEGYGEPAEDVSKTNGQWVFDKSGVPFKLLKDSIFALGEISWNSPPGSWALGQGQALIQSGVQWDDLGRIEVLMPNDRRVRLRIQTDWHGRKTFCLGTGDVYPLHQIQMNEAPGYAQIKFLQSSPYSFDWRTEDGGKTWEDALTKRKQ